MKKKYLKFMTRIAIMFAICIGFVCCNDDDDIDDSGTPDSTTKIDTTYILATTVGNSDMATYATYSQVFDFDSEVSSYDNSNASEIEPSYSLLTLPFNGSVFYNKYTNSTLEKWDVDNNGNFSETASIDFTDLGYNCIPCFYDSTTAFVGGPGTSKIAIFNPKTMMRTGFIDFSKYSKIDSITNFPSAGDSVKIESPSEIIIRGDYMYMAMYYYQSLSTWMPCTKTCEIIVIDLTKVDLSSADNSDAIVKQISDTRGSYTGSWASGYGSTFMVTDENDDIYVLCHNMWAYYGAVTGLPSCVLRIKDGETDFDDDYYFDLENASGGDAVLGLEYSGDGKFFAVVQDQSAIDPSNPYSYYIDPIYQWFQFDLYNKTATKVSDTYTKGAEDSKCYFEGDYAYIPMVTSDECYIMKTNIETLEKETLFTTVGDPVIFRLK